PVSPSKTPPKSPSALGTQKYPGSPLSPHSPPHSGSKDVPPPRTTQNSSPKTPSSTPSQSPSPAPAPHTPSPTTNSLRLSPAAIHISPHTNSTPPPPHNSPPKFPLSRAPPPAIDPAPPP